MIPCPIKVGGMPHLLLSVACAEPLTAIELRGRVAKRYARTGVVRTAMHRLKAYGLLRVAQTRPSRTPQDVYLYVLTAEGEAVLDELAPVMWERSQGAA